MMRTMFSHPNPSPAANSASLTPSSPEIMENFADLMNYPADERQSCRLLAVPKLKKWKLDIPYHEQRRLRSKERSNEFWSAYTDVKN